MPGLRQLQQFSSDLLAVGNEVSIRASRGEKPVKLPIPEGITIDDDSEDFVLGMPENEAVIESAPAVDEDLSDLVGLGTPQNDAEGSSEPSFDTPDLSSLLNPINVPDDASAGADMPDLSMFMDPEEVEEEQTPEPEEISIADMGLEALLAGGGFDQPEEEENSEPEEIAAQDDLPSADEFNLSDDLGLSEDLPSSDDFNFSDDLGLSDDLPPTDDFNFADDLPATDDFAANDDFSIDNELPGIDDFGVAEESAENTLSTDDILPAEDFNLTDDLGLSDDLSATDDLAPAEDFNIPDDLPAMDDFATTDSLSPTDDLGIGDDLTSGDDFGINDELPSTDDFNLPEDFGTSEELPATDDLAPAEDFNLPDDFGASEDLPSTDDFNFTDDLPAMDDFGANDELPASDDFAVNEDLNDDFSPADDFNLPGDFGTGEELPSTDDLTPAEDFNLPDDFGSSEDLPATDDFNVADDLSSGDDFSSNDEIPSTEDFGSFDDLSTDGLDDISTEGLDDFGSDTDLPSFGTGSVDDFSVPDDFSADTFGGEEDSADFGLDASDVDSFEDNSSEETPEVFDISEMDGMEFDMPETDEQMDSGSGFDLGNGDDFAMEGDFEIPGFSDVETIKEDKKSVNLASGKDKKSKRNRGNNSSDLDEPDFSEAMESEELPPNTLSDAQYKVFLKNLSEYPLNVRLAVEDLLVKDEFTEDAEFEIIEKILNKVPARQLAGTLEKMLDTSIPVPRDYEHRTAEEYEAYKKSLNYQLRNKIIPGAIAIVGLMIVSWGLFNFGKNCIYKPLRANSLYKQGYTLLQESEYPQSEMKFKDATKYRLSKKWFFNYARGYREHKQYQRAGTMYQNILYCFKHDKEAGLEYAAMELEDLANYERAEEIVKREVLDYHINDPDGILLLGDTYLEWGTEKDPEKLEMARQQYATLIQLYKPNDLYVSRMMRYFIRSDKLLSVLQIKDNFQKDKQLVPEDWTELSGYLLEKYYGPLAPADEYLRYQIEGLRGLLIKATKNDSDNPIAFYNLGRYYVLSKEMAGIESTMQKAIKKFNTSESLKRRDIYKYIDSYRLLGEYYTETTDYLQAQEQFTEGISLYTTERDNAGFEGTPQVGKLFEDLANIKYFVSGDYDEALLNYKNSVELNNDTPEIRYKIGYIQYQNKNYIEALGSFMKAGDGNVKEENLMLAMANTLSLRGDDYTAQGYYERLINKMDLEIAEKGLVLPQKNMGDHELVTQYLYAANNYGVTLYRLAKRTGNSALNAQAIVQFQQSVRAWDALTRNQSTLVRLGGSNLAEQNIQYITHRLPEFEPSIYISIPNVLSEQDHL